MPLAEAQALLGAGTAPHIAPHDPQADRKLLQLLAGWCARYSPLMGLEQSEEPSALFFDLTGCSHLFGGEEEMAAQVARDFQHAGYFVRIAVADTIGAAWAAVRYSSRHAPHADGTRSVPATIIPPCRQAALLRDLPVAALRLSADVVETLHELGIRQIGQLQGLPRNTLPARFGPSVLERLDQALGLTQELIVPIPPCEPIAADWSFEEPTADRRALEAVLHRLIGEITETLASRQEGAQRLECRLFCAGKEPVHLAIGTLQPTAVAEHLCELIHLQLERTKLAGEVLAVHVEVTASGPLGTQQEELFDAGIHRDGQRHLAVLLDRLSSRLGEKAVLRPYVHPDPQPEYASRLVAALSSGAIPREARGSSRKRGKKAAAGVGSGGVEEWGSDGAGEEILNCKLKEAASVHSENLKFSIFNFQFSISPSTKDESIPDYRLINAPAARPLCLKPRPIPIEVISIVPDGPPVRFRWQGGEHVIENCWGPERIETGWWRGPHVERDYYRVETATGQRFWLFRHNDTRKWFLHGTFE
jgi:protein ImuB